MKECDMKQLPSEMTPRDVFAFGALIALANATSTPEKIAASCYAIADAMLTARERRPTTAPRDIERAS